MNSDATILSTAIFNLADRMERGEKDAKEKFLEEIKDIKKFNSKIHFVKSLYNRVDAKTIKQIRKVGEKIFEKVEDNENCLMTDEKENSCIKKIDIPELNAPDEYFGVPIRVHQIIQRVKNFKKEDEVFFSPGEVKIMKYVRSTFDFADPKDVILKLLGYDGEIKLAMTQILHLLMHYPRKLYFNMIWVKNHCSEKMKEECNNVFNTILVEAKNTHALLTYVALWRFIRTIDIHLDTLYVQYITTCYNLSLKSFDDLESFLLDEKNLDRVNIEQRRFHRKLKKYILEDERWRDTIKLFLYTLKKVMIDGTFGDAAQTGYIVDLMVLYDFPVPYFIPLEKIAFDVSELYSPTDNLFGNIKSNVHNKRISDQLRQGVMNLIQMFEQMEEADIRAVLPSILEEINDDRVLRILHDGNYSADPDTKIEALKYIDKYEDAKLILQDLQKSDDSEIIDLLDSPEAWSSKDILNGIIDDILSRRRGLAKNVLDRKLILDELRKLISESAAEA
jgi:hypothetical protein